MKNDRNFNKPFNHKRDEKFHSKNEQFQKEESRDDRSFSSYESFNQSKKRKFDDSERDRDRGHHRSQNRYRSYRDDDRYNENDYQNGK